jgi:hypothetical protein
MADKEVWGLRPQPRGHAPYIPVYNLYVLNWYEKVNFERGGRDKVSFPI